MKSSLTDTELDALRAVRQAFPSTPLALIGAAALGVHLPMTWRRTADLDLVVAVAIDDAVGIMAALPGWAQHPHKEHEWHAPGGTRVDIVAAPEEALRRGTLIWPRSGSRMNVAGLRHAFAAPVVAIGEGIALSVPSVPVIALLKIAAYLDRPAERERDLTDLGHILGEYPETNDDRFFEDEILERGLVEQDARPFILGREMSALVDTAERELVERFLRAAGREGPLASRFAANGPWARSPDTFEERVKAWRLGFSTPM